MAARRSAKVVLFAHQARSWELRAATSLARLYMRQKKATKARRLMTPVVEWFTEGHETGDVKAARAILIEASSHSSRLV